MRSLAVYDLETTGLSSQSDAIIQIAAVRIENGTILKNDCFFSYVNPLRHISSWISNYTGITNEDVADSPGIDKILPEFSKWVGDSTLIAHNGNRFDMKFLHAACQLYNFRTRPVNYADSIHLSWKVWGRGGLRHGLDAITERLGLVTAGQKRHDARGDTIILAEAILRMAAQYRLTHFGISPNIPINSGFLPKY